MRKLPLHNNSGRLLMLANAAPHRVFAQILVLVVASLALLGAPRLVAEESELISGQLVAGEWDGERAKLDSQQLFFWFAQLEDESSLETQRLIVEAELPPDLQLSIVARSSDDAEPSHVSLSGPSYSAAWSDLNLPQTAVVEFGVLVEPVWPGHVVSQDFEFAGVQLRESSHWDWFGDLRNAVFGYEPWQGKSINSSGTSILTPMLAALLLVAVLACWRLPPLQRPKWIFGLVVVFSLLAFLPWQLDMRNRAAEATLLTADLAPGQLAMQAPWNQYSRLLENTISLLEQSSERDARIVIVTGSSVDAPRYWANRARYLLMPWRAGFAPRGLAPANIKQTLQSSDYLLVLGQLTSSQYDQASQALTGRSLIAADNGSLYAISGGP